MNMMEIYPKLTDWERNIVKSWLTAINQTPNHEVEILLLSQELIREAAERWFLNYTYEYSATKPVYDRIFGPKNKC